MKENASFFLDPNIQIQEHSKSKELLKGLLSIQHPERMISHFLKEMGRIHSKMKGVFVKYLPFRHLLLITHEHGFTQTKGKGFYLPSPKKEADLKEVEHPLKSKKICGFLHQILKNSSLQVFPVKVLKQTKGFFVVESSLFFSSSEEKTEKTEEFEENFLESVKLLNLVLENLELRFRLHDSKHVQEFPFVLKKSFLFETLRKEFARSLRIKQAVSFLLLSIDDFFRFRIKDEMAVAKWKESKMTKLLFLLLKRQLRLYDWVIQLSEKEFGLILPHTDQKKASLIAERLRVILEATNVSSFFGLNQKKDNLFLTLSQGVCEYPSHCKTPEEALKRADEALYQVKTHGKNRVCLSIAPNEHFKPDFDVQA